MKNFKQKLTLLFFASQLLSLLPLQAYASSYVDLGLVLLDTELESDSTDLNALHIGVGREINPNLAIEGTLAIGLGQKNLIDDTDPIGNRYIVDSELKSLVTGSLILKNNADNVTFYGKVGLAFLEYDFHIDDLTVTGDYSDSDSKSDSGLLFGLGIGFDIGLGDKLKIEYLQLPDVSVESSNLESSSLTIAYRLGI